MEDVGLVRGTLTTALSVISATGLFWLGGCGYSIAGRVTEALSSNASVVAGEPEGDGISGARIQLFRDPDKLSRELVAETTSASDGSFILDIAATGAGWLDERWRLRASRGGYGGCEVDIILPPQAKARWLAIELAPGAEGRFPSQDDADRLHKQAQEFGVSPTGR